MKWRRSTLLSLVRASYYYGRRVPDSHRFQVVVLAFKAVYTLETRRRENDKRVLALYVEYVASNFDWVPRLINSG